MAWKVTWSGRAKTDVREINDYWVDRTGSDAYPIKLEESFFEAADSLENTPYLGKATQKAENVRYLVVGYHKLFYAIFDHEIVILSVFDTRRDPENTPY